MAKGKGVTAMNETLAEYLKRKASEGNEEFDLPSGLRCRMTYFNGRKALKMKEIVGEKVDDDLALGALIHLCCEFSTDGEVWSRIIPEDAPELLQGFDYTTLLGKLQGISLEESR
jgi:hypothetical protein